MKRILLTTLTLILSLTAASAQNQMSLDEAIHTARHRMFFPLRELDADADLAGSGKVNPEVLPN